MLILFLTVQPLLINANFIANNKAADKCCADKNNTKNKSNKESSNNCCHDGHCDNPFLSCANCYFINFDKQTSLVVYPFTAKVKIRPGNDDALSAYIQDIWHPPKNV